MVKIVYAIKRKEGMSVEDFQTYWSETHPAGQHWQAHWRSSRIVRLAGMANGRRMAMPVKPVPDGYHTVTPFIVVEDPGGLIAFVKEAFGAEERMRMKRPDGSIMHAEVEIGDSVVMVGGASGEGPPKTAMLHLYVPDVDASHKRAVDAGGESLREPTDRAYRDRSAGLKDRWGNEWWLATHIEDV